MVNLSVLTREVDYSIIFKKTYDRDKHLIVTHITSHLVSYGDLLPVPIKLMMKGETFGEAF